MRDFAAGSPEAMAASATRRTDPRPAPCRRCAAAPQMAKFDSGALAATFSASSKPLARPVRVRRGTARGRCDSPPRRRRRDRSHHVGHARGTDQARHPRRAAAADEDAARALGQPVVRALLGDADVRRGRELEAAADNGTVQHRDHRHAAVLDALERGVPGPGMQHRLGDAALLQLREVEPRAEVLAVAAEDDGAGVARQLVEGDLQLRTSGSLRALRFAGRRGGVNHGPRFDRQVERDGRHCFILSKLGSPCGFPMETLLARGSNAIG